MFEESVNSILRNSLLEGLPELVMASGAVRRLPDVMRNQAAGASLLLVADNNTWKAAGGACHAVLQKKYNVIPLIIKGTPRPDLPTVEIIRAAADVCGAIIAVGSGTINDLCKYAGAQCGKPYIIVATAPSMNGYVSANASIIIKGHKASLPAHPPQAVLCDMDILVSAPVRLIRAGLGDCLARSTAQGDWLLSHYILGTAYDERPFKLTAPYENALLQNAKELVKGDLQAIDLLMKTLLLSGFGMTIAKGSYPASQGEHMIAHTMEMIHGDALPFTYHGEQIGVAALTMAKLQHQMISSDKISYATEDYESRIMSYFNTEDVSELMESYISKLSKLELDAHDLQERWKSAKDVIKKIMLSPETMEKALVDAGAPMTPEALGWDAQDYANAVAHAKYSRDRFTFLELYPSQAKSWGILPQTPALRAAPCAEIPKS